MAHKDSLPEWFPFALVASGLVMIAAGAKSGWKLGGKKEASTQPPPVDRAAFP